MRHASRISRALLAASLSAVSLAGGACGSRDRKAAQTAETPAAARDAAGDLGANLSAPEKAGRVALSPEAFAAAGIVLQPAGPHTVRLTLDLPGEVAPNADRLAHIVPRFPGIATEVKKSLGDAVARGDVLAIIEGNESLSPYEVRSLTSGTIIEKHITLGEFVRDDADIFVVSDLSNVWVNITVYARDLERVRKGQGVEIAVVGGGPRASSAIDYIGSSLGEATRAATARAVLPNPYLAWRPGMFVTATVTLEEATVPIAVPDSAVQRVEGKDAVFVEADSGFEVRPVGIGRSDGVWMEILSGLSLGERFVSRGAFILKSEVMKSAAGEED